MKKKDKKGKLFNSKELNEALFITLILPLSAILPLYSMFLVYVTTRSRMNISLKTLICELLIILLHNNSATTSCLGCKGSWVQVPSLLP